MGRILALLSLVLAACPDQSAPQARSERTPREAAPAPPATPTATATAAAPPSPPPSASADEPPASAVRPHTVPRAELGTGEKLPRHGIVVHSFGLAGESVITVDADAGTLRTRASLMGKPRRIRTRKLPAKAIARLVDLATAAWIEEPTGPMSLATDVREDLYVVDGDDAFLLQGFPIAAFGSPTGRPAASRAVEALYRAAR